MFADAALDRAVPGASMGVFGNQGEVCSAGGRVFVIARLRRRLAGDDRGTRTSGMKLGSRTQSRHDDGCRWCRRSERDRVQCLHERGPARAERGWRSAYAGQPAALRWRAAFVAPTSRGDQRPEDRSRGDMGLWLR